MALINLGYAHVLTTDIEATKQFYFDTLGLEEGYRPPFDFSGAWLYLKDFPVLHLTKKNDQHKTSSIETPIVDHIAFNAEAYDETVEHLTALNVLFTETTIPETKTHQLFFKDPNGVTIELTFPFN